MIKFILTTFVVLIINTGYSQTETFVANGKVFSDTALLAGASIFCQNTTIGTITNAEGEFSLRLPKGGYDLIVSYTGFETQQMHINAANSSNLTFQLKVKDNSLSEFTVSASNEVVDGFVKYGQFFIDNFIGTTPNAAECTIENPEVLQFFFSKKRNRLKVREKEELVVLNKALGYKIKYQLDSFVYEYGTDISFYTGYPFFEELTGSDEDKERWKENRNVAYNGSRLHFIRSLYDSTLEDEGFAIEWIDPTKKTLTTRPIDNPYDSAYYAVAENSDVEISYTGKYRVIYKNEMPEKKFLVQYKLPLYLKSQLSILDIADPFTIEQNGYFYEQADIVNTGYWSWEKVAELLPYDYNPQ